MTIGKKLYGSFGIILTMVVVLFCVNWVAVQREHAAKSAAQASLELADTTNAVRFQMMQDRLYLSNYLLSGDTREVDRMNEGLRILNDKLEQGKSLADSEQEKSALSKVEQLEQSWGKEFAQPLIDKRKDVDSGNATVAELQIYYLQKDASSWVKNSTDTLDVADGENRKLVEARRKSDETAATGTIIVSLLSTAIALVFGGLIAYRTAKSITGPLNNLMTVSRQIADTGDLEHTLEHLNRLQREHNIEVKRADEIGELASSFAQMVTYLKEMADVSQAIAEGDLRVEVKPRSQRDTLGNAFARMVEGLGSLVRSVRDASSQVASASNQVAGASDDSAKVGLQASSAIDEVTSTMHEMSVNVQNMVKSTQVQASSVSETSASIDQMVASIQRVADTAKVLLDISNRSREEVHSGIATMEKATDGLNRINVTITSSGEIIGVLGQRADDIGAIIEVIDDLAEQTNLLALNAAIEAARAGEHGLGFAVVADEVRKLAEKSAQSTKEISELIQSIQKEARKAVENMNRSTTIVNEGLEQGGALNAALRKISSVVTEVYKFAQEIGAATNEQSHGSSQIARATTRLNEITHEINSAVEEQASGAQAVVKAMERMRELVQQSTSGSTELAASSEQMSKMSRGLLEFLDRFALEDNTRSHSAPYEEPNSRSAKRAAAGARF
jgi:methyl-accepting chemotaxis protein